MPVLYIPKPDNETLEVNYQQFVLNDHQQIMVVGMDFDKHGGIVEPETDGAKATHLGKLSELGIIWNMQIRNSLLVSNDKWDWEECPDPEIILLTREK